MRPGDHLLCPFECDTCAFHHLKGRAPTLGNKAGDALLVRTHQASLDALWSQATSAAKGLVGIFNRQVLVGEQFGFEMCPPRGPFAQGYGSGVKVAVGTLWETRQAGSHEEKKKLSSCHQVCSLSTSMHDGSAIGASNNVVWRSARACFAAAAAAPSDSEWASSFLNSCKAQTGERVKQDAAITVKQVLAIQDLCVEECDEVVAAGSLARQREVCEAAALFALPFSCSLWGFEMPKIVLRALLTKAQLEGSDEAPAHIAAPLRGKLKARSSRVTSLLVRAALKAAAGVKPGIWVCHLIGVLAEHGITSGWLFQEPDGSARRVSGFGDAFFGRLLETRERDPTLFEPEIDVINDRGAQVCLIWIVTG